MGTPSCHSARSPCCEPYTSRPSSRLCCPVSAGKSSSSSWSCWRNGDSWWGTRKRRVCAAPSTCLPQSGYQRTQLPSYVDDASPFADQEAQRLARWKASTIEEPQACSCSCKYRRGACFEAVSSVLQAGARPEGEKAADADSSTADSMAVKLRAHSRSPRGSPLWSCLMESHC